MRAQRSGERTTRRIEGKPLLSRKRAVAPLAATMKSSISCLARFCSSARRSVSASPSNTGRASMRLEVERAVLVPLAPHRLRDAVLHAELLVDAGHRGDRRGHRAGRLEPRGDRVVGELRAVAHARAVDVGAGDGAVGVHRHLDDDRQAVLAVAERREVGGEPLGQHREDLRPPCTPTSCCAARDRRSASPLRDRGVDVGDGDEDRHDAAGQRLARPRAGRDRASRRCRSTPTRAREGRGSRRPSRAPARRWRRAAARPRARTPAAGRARA